MRILLTGASSFTGYWFARQLAANGHDLVMPLRGSLAAYEGVRRERAARLPDFGHVVEGVAFGSPEFMDCLGDGAAIDVLCHHAATVEGYREPDFDVSAALAGNIRGIREVLDRFGSRGGRAVVLTGSVFEGRAGVGTDADWAFSPYGLSKQLTTDVFRWYCRDSGIPLGRFVIPNPFGPYEEPRFVAYLFRSWFESRVPEVRTPDYVRDNIHVSLLALAYSDFVTSVGDSTKQCRESVVRPSGYVESQGAFARRLAREMSSRLHIDCNVATPPQESHPEPHLRIGDSRVAVRSSDWTDAEAWDALATYYRERLSE